MDNPYLISMVAKCLHATCTKRPTSTFLVDSLSQSGGIARPIRMELRDLDSFLHLLVE